MAKRSQFQFRNGVPGGIFHHLQCSAGRMGIPIKLLILYGKLAVTAKRECWVPRGGKGDEQGRRCHSRRLARRIVHIRAPVDWTEAKKQSICQCRSAGNGVVPGVGGAHVEDASPDARALWGLIRSAWRIRLTSQKFLPYQGAQGSIGGRYTTGCDRLLVLAGMWESETHGFADSLFFERGEPLSKPVCCPACAEGLRGFSANSSDFLSQGQIAETSSRNPVIITTGRFLDFRFFFAYTSYGSGVPIEG